MRIILLTTVIFAVISSILYRMGGAAGFNKLWRRLGCMFVVTIWLAFFYEFHGLIILTMGLAFVSLGTYFDEIFGYDNHFVHCGAITASALPLVFITGNWIGFVLAVIVSALLGGFWSKWNTHHVIEELGRGVIIIITLPLLLIGG